CWTVIEAAASGSAKERDAFAARYDPMIRAYLGARWRRSPHLADLDDAAQEVFLECLRRGGALDRAERTRASGFRAFLYGVVRHVALRIESGEALERSRRHSEEDIPLEDVKADAPALSRAFDRSWATALIREAALRQADAASRSGDAASRRVELLRLR